MGKLHVPVLLQSACDALEPGPGKRFIDATFGNGGHAKEISHRGGQVLGIDQDAEVLSPALTSSLVSPQIQITHGNFLYLKDIAKRHDFIPIDGVLFDLGISSFQLDNSLRGFSFQVSGPLDMRMDQSQSVTAAYLLNQLPEKDLSGIFSQYGEVKHASLVAKKIVSSRPLHTTDQLSGLLSNDHQRRQVFQAIRIAVNAELFALETALPQAFEILKPGGKIVVISFHSLEDRIVKRQFSNWQKSGLGFAPLSHPIRPNEWEIGSNPRSKSAKLRVFIKKYV